jgi:hypothetical protein
MNDTFVRFFEIHPSAQCCGMQRKHGDDCPAAHFTKSHTPKGPDDSLHLSYCFTQVVFVAELTLIPGQANSPKQITATKNECQPVFRRSIHFRLLGLTCGEHISTKVYDMLANDRSECFSHAVIFGVIFAINGM